MKKFCILILTVMILFATSTAFAESNTITLGNDVIVNTTPFGNVPVNQQYKLFAGMVVTVIGEYDGWTVIHYGDEFGVLFMETGAHSQKPSVSIPTVPGTESNEVIAYGIVGEGYRVWARYEPRSVFEEGEEKGDEILYAGDVIEIVGNLVTDDQGNKYYPIRVKRNGYYVKRYVTAKYIDLPLE